MTEPRTLRSVDPSGRETVRVEMSNVPNVFATVEAPDYDRLISEGVSPRWFINNNGAGVNYVRAAAKHVKGDLTLISRLILDAGRGETIRYSSFDRLDLRRSNIALRKGGWAKDRTMTPRQALEAAAL